MWVITHYTNLNITMYEYNTEKEAKEALKDLKGYKILSHIVYFNDPIYAV
ncbi:hypothetical protein [Neobacillus cucumis]|jgi:hypothetical protein|nr:hypothetical protein [Neobacillus cucumis]